MEMPFLAARGLNKSFGPNDVLKGIEFEIHGGHAVALCGENGAGKSTLIKLLTGLYTPTSGHVEFEGQPAAWSDPRQSLAAGIAVVHQEFSVLGALSIAENIYLGAEPRTKWGLIDRKALKQDAKALLADLGIHLNPDDLVETLSVADKQMVEIAKALRAEAKVLILDEPTAVLSQNETKHLFRIINDLRARGMGLVYVSHRLDEIFEICTDITVIKDGVVTSKGPTTEYTHDSVIAAMVGRELGDLFPHKAANPTAGEKVSGGGEPCGGSAPSACQSGCPCRRDRGPWPVWSAQAEPNWRWPCSARRPRPADVTLMGEPMPHRDPAGCIEAGISDAHRKPQG